MFSLTVCDHIMIAHSFQGEEFGPAQRLHGATYAVEAEFRAPRLDRLNLLIDIGLAKVELRRILALSLVQVDSTADVLAGPELVDPETGQRIGAGQRATQLSDV